MPWPDMADRMLGVAVRTFSQSDPDGETRVQYMPKGASSYPLSAVFDKAHVSVDPGTGVPISSTNPVLGVRLSDMQAEPKKGDRVQVSGVIYSVVDSQPDGVAGVMLELHKA